MSDFRQVRRRIDDDRISADRQPPPALAGTRKGVFRVYNAGAIPTSVPAYFATHRVDVSGAEAEGGAATLTLRSGTTLVLVLSGQVPTAGTDLIAHLIDGRWVAKRVPVPTVGLTFIGCNGLGFNANMNVTVYDATHTTVLASGTVDAAGFFSLGALPNGSYTFDAASTASPQRFVPYVNQPFTIPGGPFAYSPAAASGYVCVGSACFWPIATTLHGSGTVTFVTVGGSTTVPFTVPDLVWTGTVWTGSRTVGATTTTYTLTPAWSFDSRANGSAYAAWTPSIGCPLSFFGAVHGTSLINFDYYDITITE